jgi:hypothetical protein
MVNELGNYMLLEKNLTISKSDKPLKQFLEGVHEFKAKTVTVEEWATALDLKMPQVDSANTALDILRALSAERTQKIRGDLEQFIRGTKSELTFDLTASTPCKREVIGHHQYRHVRTDKVFPTRCLLPLGSRWYIMAAENIAHRLIREPVTEVGHGTLLKTPYALKSLHLWSRDR